VVKDLELADSDLTPTPAWRDCGKPRKNLWISKPGWEFNIVHFPYNSIIYKFIPN